MRKEVAVHDALQTLVKENKELELDLYLRRGNGGSIMRGQELG